MVEDRELAGRDRTLRFLEAERKPVFWQRLEGCRRGGRPIADLGLDPSTIVQGFGTEEARVPCHKAVCQQIFVVPDDQGVAPGVDINDEQRAIGCDAETAPLADGVAR